jgi:predicted GIY-YIG superfamily endonuclease
MFIVYVLFSGTHQKHYTGFTSNLADRLLSHQALGKDWTSKFRPWKLIRQMGLLIQMRRCKMRKAYVKENETLKNQVAMLRSIIKSR